MWRGSWQRNVYALSYANDIIRKDTTKTKSDCSEVTIVTLQAVIVIRSHIGSAPGAMEGCQLIFSETKVSYYT